MAKLKIKTRSVFSLENFNGLNSEDAKTKVSSNMSVKMSNFDIDSGVLKTRPSVKVKRFITGINPDVEIIDYYNMYYSSTEYNTIFVTDDGFYFWDRKYNRTYKFTSSGNEDPNISIFTQVTDAFVSGNKPVYQQEKDCLFVFCLDKIYVISVAEENTKHIWFLYEISNKPAIELYLYANTLEEKTIKFYNDLPEPYIPLIASVGNSVNSVDGVNLISNKRKYHLYSKTTKNDNGDYEYNLPTDYTDETNKSFDYKLDLDGIGEGVYCKPTFFKCCEVSDITSSIFTDEYAKITFLKNDELYPISNVMSEGEVSEIGFVNLTNKMVNRLKEKIVLDEDETLETFDIERHKVLFAELKDIETTFYKLIAEYSKKTFVNPTNLYIAIPFVSVYGTPSVSDHNTILFLYMPLKSSITFEDEKISILNYSATYGNLDFDNEGNVESSNKIHSVLTEEVLTNEEEFTESELIKKTKTECYKLSEQSNAGTDYIFEKDFSLEQKKRIPLYKPLYDVVKLNNQYLENNYLQVVYIDNLGYTPQPLDNSSSGSWEEINSKIYSGSNFSLKLTYGNSLSNENIKDLFLSFLSENSTLSERSIDEKVYVVDYKRTDVASKKPYMKEINNYTYHFERPCIRMTLKDIIDSVNSSFDLIDGTENIAGSKRIVYFKTPSFKYDSESETSLNSITHNTKYVYGCLIINFSTKYYADAISETETEKTKKAKVRLLYTKGSSDKDTYTKVEMKNKKNLFEFVVQPDIINLFSNDYTPVKLLVSYEDDSKNYDKVAKCKIGTNFGLENRLILAGNEEYPNIDRYNVSNDILDVENKSQSYELSYFPSKNYDVVGGLGKINAFSIASDSVMYITKEYYPNDSMFFVRNRTIDDNGKVVYSNIRTSIDKTCLNSECFKRFLNDTIMLTSEGLFGVELTDNYITSKRLIIPRDAKIRKELIDDISNVEEPKLVIHNKNLFIVLGSVVYVADYTRVSRDEEGNLTYNFVKWNFDKEIKTIKVLNDVLEYRFEDTRVVYEFGSSDEDDYIDTNKVFYLTADNGNYIISFNRQIPHYNLYKIIFYDKITGVRYECDGVSKFNLLNEVENNGTYTYNLSSDFSTTNVSNFLNNYVVCFEKIEPIAFFYQTPVFDFNSPISEKTLFEVFFYANRLAESNSFIVQYRTMRGYNEIDVTQTVGTDNNLNFDILNFNTLAVNSFSEFGAKKPLKINDFLYVQFAFSGIGKVEISSIKMLYKNNRIIKTIG